MMTQPGGASSTADGCRQQGPERQTVPDGKRRCRPLEAAATQCSIHPWLSRRAPRPARSLTRRQLRDRMCRRRPARRRNVTSQTAHTQRPVFTFVSSSAIPLVADSVGRSWHWRGACDSAQSQRANTWAASCAQGCGAGGPFGRPSPGRSGAWRRLRLDMGAVNTGARRRMAPFRKPVAPAGRLDRPGRGEAALDPPRRLVGKQPPDRRPPHGTSRVGAVPGAAAAGRCARSVVRPSAGSAAVWPAGGLRGPLEGWSGPRRYAGRPRPPQSRARPRSRSARDGSEVVGGGGLPRPRPRPRRISKVASRPRPLTKSHTYLSAFLLTGHSDFLSTWSWTNGIKPNEQTTERV